MKSRTWARVIFSASRRAQPLHQASWNSAVLMWLRAVAWLAGLPLLLLVVVVVVSLQQGEA
jgi:hypothetical protein